MKGIGSIRIFGVGQRVPCFLLAPLYDKTGLPSTTWIEEIGSPEVLRLLRPDPDLPCYLELPPDDPG